LRFGFTAETLECGVFLCLETLILNTILKCNVCVRRWWSYVYHETTGQLKCIASAIQYMLYIYVRFNYIHLLAIIRYGISNNASTIPSRVRETKQIFVLHDYPEWESLPLNKWEECEYWLRRTIRKAMEMTSYYQASHPKSKRIRCSEDAPILC